jgi:hypothetical protein
LHAARFKKAVDRERHALDEELREGLLQPDQSGLIGNVQRDRSMRSAVEILLHQTRQLIVRANFDKDPRPGPIHRFHFVCKAHGVDQMLAQDLANALWVRGISVCEIVGKDMALRRGKPNPRKEVSQGVLGWRDKRRVERTADGDGARF